MGFLACLPSSRESLSASPHGARNPVTLDLKARTVRNQKTRVEWALTCSRGGCAVDASPVLSLVSRFSQRGGVRLQCCLQTPRMHPLPWVRVGRPRVASGSSWALHSLAHLAWTANSLSRSQAAVPSISAPASGSAPHQQSAVRSPSSGPRHSHARSPAPAVRGICAALRGIVPRVLSRRLLPGHQPAW